MSISEEIATAIQQANGGIGQALTAANAAKQKAEQAIQQSTALGNRDAIAQNTATMNAIDGLIAILNGSREKAAQAHARARAALG